MYVSDYAYATSGSGLPDDSTTNRDGCLAYPLNEWYSGNYQTNCAGNSWLWYPNSDQWTLTLVSSDPSRVFTVRDNGRADHIYGVQWLSAVASPSLYLKSAVKILDGDGSSAKPYILTQ